MGKPRSPVQARKCPFALLMVIAKLSLTRTCFNSKGKSVRIMGILFALIMFWEKVTARQVSLHNFRSLRFQRSMIGIPTFR